MLRNWIERYHVFARSVINADSRRVGGIYFVKIGRLTIALSLSRQYRPIGR